MKELNLFGFKFSFGIQRVFPTYLKDSSGTVIILRNAYNNIATYYRPAGDWKCFVKHTLFKYELHPDANFRDKHTLYKATLEEYLTSNEGYIDKETPLKLHNSLQLEKYDEDNVDDVPF